MIDKSVAARHRSTMEDEDILTACYNHLTND